MSEIIPRMPLIMKNKWPILFAVGALVVMISGFTVMQGPQVAQAQFGPLMNLPSPAQTTEVHCGQLNMKPAGNGTFGGSAAPCIDTGDTTFMYIAAVIVMIMTPGGLGFLYGGLTRRKHSLMVILQNFQVYAIVSIQWVVWGYSLLFGPSADPYGFIGNLNWVGLNNVFHNAPADVYAPTIPHLGYAMFQLMFAAITPALAIAGYADRVKMSAFLIHVVLWSTFIYDFVGHANWSLGSQGTAVGWLANIGTEDFAGGTVIHITSGFAGLASAMFLGRRIGYGKAPFEPHSLPLMMLGAILLWYGWFGFNPGSSGFAGFLETQAFQNTNLATAVAALWWMFLSWAHTGKASAIGAANGAVSALVAITPASGYIGTWASIIVGFACATTCFYAVLIKNRARIDDALDTWGVHGIGGVTGALLTGAFSETRINPFGHNGLFFGNPIQEVINAQGACFATLWSFSLTYIMWKVQDAIWPGGVRVTPKEEEIGLDLSQVGENAYSQFAE